MDLEVNSRLFTTAPLIRILLAIWNLD